MQMEIFNGFDEKNQQKIKPKTKNIQTVNFYTEALLKTV